MKKFIIILFLFLIILIGRCAQNQEIDHFSWIDYKFNLPCEFPFQIDKQYVELETTDYSNQFIFHYINTATSQQIKYIICIINLNVNHLNTSYNEGSIIKLDNGLEAYYEDTGAFQSICWVEGDVSTKYYYSIDYYEGVLDNEKLEVDILVDLANQVQ